VRCHSD